MNKLVSFSSHFWDTLNWILKSESQSHDKIVVFVPWFERCWTTEPKFRIVWDLLRKNFFSTFQFDFTWLWLSWWDFINSSLESYRAELKNALLELTKLWNCPKIYIIAHSFGCCIISDIIDRFEKVVLISPALNQKELNKYWFVKQYMKKHTPTTSVSWDNFNIFLNENSCYLLNKYEEYVHLPVRSTKYNYIWSSHLLSVWDNDFSSSYCWFENKIFHIHWSKDDVVPLESLNITFQNKLIVENWDHELESKDIALKWSSNVLDFFK